MVHSHLFATKSELQALIKDVHPLEIESCLFEIVLVRSVHERMLRRLNAKSNEVEERPSKICAHQLWTGRYRHCSELISTVSRKWQLGNT